MSGGTPERAVVVLHGIGKQQRGATLNAFSAGLLARPDVDEADLTPDRVPFGEPRPPARKRLRSNGKEVDVYEVYWSPNAANQTTARSVLAWVLKLTFVPFKKPGVPLHQSVPKSIYDRGLIFVALALAGATVLIALASFSVLADQAECVSESHDGCSEILSGLNLRDRGVLEVGRSGELLENLVSAVGRGAKRLVSTKVDSLDISKAPEVFKQMRLLEALAALGVAYLAAQVVFGMLAGLRIKGVLSKLGTVTTYALQLLFLIVLGRLLGPEGAGLSPRWSYALTLAGSLVMIVVLPKALRAFGAGGNPFAGGSPMLVALPLLLALLPFVSTPLASFVVLTVAVYALLRAGASFLSESVGDVQVYTTRDPNRKYFPVRAAVQSTAENVFAVLAPLGYKEITLVGHSLGSVIALDTLALLEGRTPNMLPSVRTLVTFGSPLEKVTYFFEQPPLPSGPGAGGQPQMMKEIGRARLAQLRQAALLTRGMRWFNIWYANDPVADPIVSYGKNARYGKGPLRRLWGDANAPPVPQMVAEGDDFVVVNLGLGWRWKSSVVWPHSDYWVDPVVADLFKRLIFD